MSIGFITFILILVGSVLLFKQQGRVVRHIKMIFVTGVMLALGGCIGALSWLGAETSGNSNIFHHVNPYIWTAIFVFGICILIVATIIGIAFRDNKDEESNVNSD